MAFDFSTFDFKTLQGAIHFRSVESQFKGMHFIYKYGHAIFLDVLPFFKKIKVPPHFIDIPLRNYFRKATPRNSLQILLTKKKNVIIADRTYATASQHLELCQHIIYHLNSCQSIATSPRLCLLEFLVHLRPSPEGAVYRVNVRTYHILRRVLPQIGQAGTIGERLFLQDVLRWTVDYLRERVNSRIKY